MCYNSFGENKIRKFLKSKKIKFFEEYKFSDCINIRPLRFDFYLPKKNICIEYDGRFHFEMKEDFYGDKAEQVLLENQQRDKIKDEYCFKNNIKLIRIPYWEFENIEEILVKELNIKKEQN